MGAYHAPIMAAFLAGCADMIALPPPECDHPPTRSVVAVEYPYFAVNGACRKAARNPIAKNLRYEGCTIGAIVPLIVIPKAGVQGVTQSVHDHLLRHEWAHVNCGAWHR